MRVAFFGNNLNQGYLVVKALRRQGVEAVLLEDDRNYGQDTHDWWTDEERNPEWIRSFKVTQGDLTIPGSLTELPQLRPIYDAAREFDVLILREYGPALFSELEGPIKFFWSSGSDLQILPFLSRIQGWRRTLQEWMFWLCRPFPDRLRHPQWRQREVDTRARWLHADLLESRQRAGLAQCHRWILMPYQFPLGDQLGYPRKQVHSWHMMMDEDQCQEYDRSLAQQLASRYRDCDLVLLHPTRQFYLRLDENRFLKDNDRLFKGYAEFLKTTRLKTVLVATEKGREPDLRATHELVRQLGLEPHVHWIPELPNKSLRSYYTLPQVVVCDQFSPHLPTMGNTGREASMYGRMLITSYDQSNHAIHGDDWPPHIHNATSPNQVQEALTRVADMTPLERAQTSAAARVWARRHLSSDALTQRVLEMLDEFSSGGRFDSARGQAA